MKKNLCKEENMAHYDAANINDKLIINFRDIKHVMHSLYEGRGSQKRILMLLLKVGTITQQKLTEKLGIQPGSASEVLSKLEKNDLIIRTGNPNDRRTTDVMLTEQGRILAEEALEQRQKRHKEMFTCLSEKEKANLLALLEKVNSDWKERYQNIGRHPRSRHGKPHAHSNHSEHFAQRDEKNGHSCDGNCRDCLHPCARGEHHQEYHDNARNHRDNEER